MDSALFDWVLNIPYVMAEFTKWLTEPLAPPYISLSPLALFGIGGVGVLTTIIVVHIVKLFLQEVINDY